MTALYLTSVTRHLEKREEQKLYLPRYGEHYEDVGVMAPQTAQPRLRFLVIKGSKSNSGGR